MSIASKKRQQRRSIQQRFIRLRGIDGHALALTASATEPGRRVYRAIIKVSGRNLTLTGTQDQLVLMRQWRDLLAGLSYPIQVVARSMPLDQSAYLAPFQDALAHAEDQDERDLLTAHLSHMQGFEEDHLLLDRSFYIIIGSEDGQQGRPASLAETIRMTLWPPLRKRVRAREQEADRQARTRLETRVQGVIRALRGMRLSTERLDNAALLTFYARCVMEARAARFPFTAAKRGALHQPVQAALPAPLPGLAQTQSEGEPKAEDASPPAASASKPRRPPRARKKERPEKAPSQQARWTQVADLVSPAGIQVASRHLCVLHEEAEYVRTIVLDALPREVAIGYLAPIVELDESFVEVSLHIMPCPKSRALSRIRSRRLDYKTSKAFAQRRGALIDDDAQIAEEDTDRLARAVAAGEEHMHDVSCSILVRAVSEEELQTRTRRVFQALEQVQATARPATFLQDEGYRSHLPHLESPLSEWGSLFLDSTSVGIAFFPFLSQSLYMPDGVFLGMTQSGEPVVLDKWNSHLNNANTMIEAPSGWGKSFVKKLWLERLWLKRRTRPRKFIVIDPEREFDRLASKTHGERVCFAPGSKHCINMFDLGGVRTEGGDRLAEKIASLRPIYQLMLGDTLHDSVEALSLLERATYEAYRRVGITSNDSIAGRQPPLLRDVYQCLKDEQKRILEQGTKIEAFSLKELHTIEQRLFPYAIGSQKALFDGPTNVSLENPMLVFDTKDLDSEITPIVLTMLAEFVWTQTFTNDQPIELVIDEAQILASNPIWARFMAHIVARARKHWLAVTIIIQDIENFQSNPYVKNLAANCDTKILLGRPHPGAVVEMLGLSEKEAELLTVSGRGEGLLMTPTTRIAVRFEANALEYEFATTQPDEVSELRKREQKEGPQDQKQLTQGEEQQEKVRQEGEQQGQEEHTQGEEGQQGQEEQQDAELQKQEVAP